MQEDDNEVRIVYNQLYHKVLAKQEAENWWLLIVYESSIKYHFCDWGCVLWDFVCKTKLVNSISHSSTAMKYIATQSTCLGISTINYYSNAKHVCTHIYILVCVCFVSY